MTPISPSRKAEPATCDRIADAAEAVLAGRDKTRKAA